MVQSPPQTESDKGVLNGGRIIAKVLRQYGVQQLYTLCGGHIAPIYVEAEREGIAIVDVRDEASTVFAADVTARLTGVPGVAAVTAGPGVTNTITALKNAQMAQSPLLLIGGATATMLTGRGALQDIDQMSLILPHVKWARQVRRLRDMAPAIHQAMQMAQKGVPGPVFVEVPVDLLYHESTIREWYAKETDKAKSLIDKLTAWYIKRHLNRLFGGVEYRLLEGGMKEGNGLPPIRTGDLKKAGDALRRAERPVMVVGSGAMMIPGQAEALAAAVKQLGVPVYLSGMARGLMGRFSEVQYRHKRSKALRAADCILLAGVPCDFRLNYGRHLGRNAHKIAVNRSREELRKNLRANQLVRVDPGQFLIALAEQAGEIPERPEWKAQLQEREDTREREIQEMATQSIEYINPLQLFLEMEEHLPDNSVLIADGGDFAATASYTLRPRRPLAWLDPGVFGTLGVGGGFALGAALRYPNDYIWIIYGDGSAAYSLMELDTFAKMGLKVCALIGNNGSWEQIARDQVPLLGKDTATSLPRSDYEKIAHAFGAAGERVETLAAFRESLGRARESMDHGVPYVINAVIGSTSFREGSISM